MSVPLDPDDIHPEVRCVEEGCGRVALFERLVGMVEGWPEGAMLVELVCEVHATD